MPEQVWDEPNRPDDGLELGRPAGSAVPLVWAHAEYLKLLRSAVDGKVFDRIDPCVRALLRAAGQEAAAQQPGDLQPPPADPENHRRATRFAFWMRADLRWCGPTDGWKTTQSHGQPSVWAVRATARIFPPAPNAESGGLSWTLHWPEQESLAWIQCGSQRLNASKWIYSGVPQH